MPIAWDQTFPSPGRKELLEQYLEEDAPMREWLSANHDDKAAYFN